MCVGPLKPKDPPPPPPPPAPAPPAPVPELKSEEDMRRGLDPSGMNRGRKKLRIDLATNSPSTGAEGTGLNIPS
jgi:hypothetical protein